MSNMSELDPVHRTTRRAIELGAKIEDRQLTFPAEIEGLMLSGLVTPNELLTLTDHDLDDHVTVYRVSLASRKIRALQSLERCSVCGHLL